MPPIRDRHRPDPGPSRPSLGSLDERLVKVEEQQDLMCYLFFHISQVLESVDSALGKADLGEDRSQLLGEVLTVRRLMDEVRIGLRPFQDDYTG